MIWLFLALFFTFLIGAKALTTIREVVLNKGKSHLEELQKSTFFISQLKNPRSFLFAIEIVETLVKLLALASGTLFILLIPLSFWERFWIGVLFFALYLFFGELWPRILREKGKISKYTALFFLFLFLPIVYPLLLIREHFGKKALEEDSLFELRETLLNLLGVYEGKTKLDQMDKKLLESVILFKDLIVKEVMVPRIHLFSISSELSIKEAARLIVKEGYSRIPVYKDNLDNIIGLLLYKDVLKIYMNCEEGALDPNFLEKPVQNIIKGVFYTPETKKVSHLLQEFRAKQKHMAIVVDEYGGTEGIVTIEDILEEIVGEIADEYDVDEGTLYIPDPKGQGWIVDARMNIKDAEEIFNIDIPKEADYDTFAGFIFYREEKIPDKGTKIYEKGFELEILSASDRSVEKIRLIIHPPQKQSSS